MSGTFSTLVDDAVSRSGRVDKRLDIIAYARQTIREMQGRHFFHKNLIEDTLTASAIPFIWIRPERIQRLRTVKYLTTGVYPKFAPPGKVQRDLTEFYYAASTYIVFSGLSLQDQVAVAYYQFSKNLAYYAAGTRPADYTEYGGWVYNVVGAINYGATTTLQATARELSANWLLLDWYDIILEGTLAKLFKLIKEIERSAMHFSQFKTQFTDTFLANELYETFDK